MQKQLEIGLIGNPCAGSLSPLLHSVLAESCGIRLNYHLWETEEEGLGQLLRAPGLDGLKGMNVTIPYKKTVMPYLTAGSPLARTLGAANTLVRTTQGLYGANTDVYGFKEFLRRRGIVLSGRDCLLLGAGGAAKAAAYAMASEGARIFLWSRNAEKGRAFVAFMNGLFPDSIVFCEDEVLCSRFFSLAVNTIPLRKEFENSLLYDRIGTSMWVDINYSVTGTPLGELCAEHGLAFADGKEMLFFQGLRSFEIWNNLFFTNREKEALLETFLRKSKRNIVLVGFMGSGKSTLSVQLEQMAGFKCHSTDLMLESKLGKSISRIFSEEGERFFRDEEQRILSLALGAGGPCVIDTGGGAVERDENRFAIQASGAFVVWLDADSEKLLERLKGSTSRPLLAGRTEEEVIALIERRRPLYRDVAHIRLDATDDPLYLAKEIMKQWSEF